MYGVFIGDVVRDACFFFLFFSFLGSMVSEMIMSLVSEVEREVEGGGRHRLARSPAEKS